ncbi:hypothetical protein O0L34_g17762 [Tuta absoluta]|nr:hypothetical protein O0L34_g17762 [Tuta absoluta]
MVLNEIINIITAHDYDTTTENRYIPALEENQKTNIKKLSKPSNIINMTTVTESSVTLENLKDIISKYSLVQNTFMKKIYNILNNLDPTIKYNKKSRSTDATNEMKSQQQQNKTKEIQVYTKNIIENLRKLRDLAQSFNRDRLHVRRKRDLGNGENVEYMLMLMEYLLKQHQPVGNDPAGDGIDQLIDAIKSAPNINTIRQKILPKYTYTATKSPVQFATKLTLNRQSKTKLISSESRKTKPYKEVASESDSKASKEENISPSVLEMPKIKMIDQTLDEDSDEQEMYVLNEKTHMTLTTETTTQSDHKSSQSKWKKIDKIYSPTNAQTDVFYNTISDLSDLRKLKSGGNKYRNDYEEASLDFFDRYTDETSSPTSPVSTLVTTEGYIGEELSTKIYALTKPPQTTQLTQLMRHFNNDDMSASKSRIDWIDETYEEEIREAHPSKVHTVTSPPPIKKIKTMKLVTKIDILNKRGNKHEDISGLSKEEVKETKKTPVQDILHKKQIDLFNSLDYGTEKRDTDMSASRESGTIDKYSGDSFNQYFREELV